MARMSIDDMFLRDPRVARLAKACGWSRFEAEGRLLHVYGLVYDRVDAGADGLLQAIDIDIAAEFEGFTEYMIEYGLAAREGRSVRGLSAHDGRSVRIRGAKERTNYLATREESGRNGGVKSGETRRKKAEAKSKVTFDKNEGRSNPSATPTVPDSAAVTDPTHTKTHARESGSGIDSDQLRDFKTKVDENACARARESGYDFSANEANAADSLLEKLGSHNGVEYSGAVAHRQLIADRLREGVTVDDMRMVIGYCALELDWSGRPEMRRSLRPETLFGASTISKYLDPARSWFRDLQAREQAQESRSA